MVSNTSLSVKDFFLQFTHLNYKRNEKIIAGGERPSGIYYLVKGDVKQYMLSSKGSIFVINIFRSDSFFLMNWILNNAPNSYFFETISPVDVFRAPLDKAKQFFEDNPDKLVDFTKRMVAGTYKFLDRIESVIMDQAYPRTIGLLLYLARIYGKTTDKKVSIRNPFTHRDLSSWLGLTRETTSIQLENLKKKNLIVYKRNFIEITDVEKLKAEKLSY